MARLLDHFVSEPRACSYLPSESASLEYRLMLGIRPAELEHLLERGWRRFGFAYFRPSCRVCSQCVPLRLPLEHFRMSRNQRRVWKRGEHIRLEIGAPLVDDARLSLYRRWHAMQGEARGWENEQIDAQRYYQEFAFPHPAVREFAYYDDHPPSGGTPVLVAISIVDETPNALSAVYTYHHPEYRKHSLGTLSVLRQLDVARQMGKRWVYLGYRVLGCASSRYKANFRPHELLAGWPGFDQAPTWKLLDQDPLDPDEPAERE